MFRNRWATGTKYSYYFNKSGAAIANRWLKATEESDISLLLIPEWQQDGRKLVNIVIILIRKQVLCIQMCGWGKYYVK